MKTTASGNPRAPFEVNYITENGKRAKKDSKSKVAADFFVEYKKESAVPIELKIYGGGRVAFYQIKQARAKSGAILQDAVEPVKANIARVSAKGKPCDESCPLQLSNAERRLGNP